MATAEQQIAQLDQARRIVLADAVHYPDIVSGIVPLIGTRSFVEIQRWGADFLAEAFASPMVSGATKEKMCLGVLSVMHDWLHNQQDEMVIKSTIQTAASIYPYVFRHVTNNQTATSVWETMTAIKASILKRFDSSPVGVRIVCVKFVQRVILVQTPGIITDPRRPEQNDISAALVPRDHPIIPLSKLEAEASGLMDRLLRVFQEPTSDAIIVDATLNCLSLLVRTRQSVSNKIISAILNFNPFKGVSTPLTGKDKFRTRSMERTVRAFLLNFARRNEHGPFVARIKQYVERNMQTRLELDGQGVSRKRGPPEPTDGLDDAKRQRLGGPAGDSSSQIPPMPPPPLTLAQVFSLTSDATSQFDAKVLPEHLVQRISVALLQSITPDRLSEAINAVRSRLLELSRSTSAPSATQAVPAPVPVADADEDDDYEPEFEPTETLEQIHNRLEAAPAETARGIDEVPEVSLGSFKLSQPAPVSHQDAQMYAKSSIGRVFNMIENIDPPANPVKTGLNRLAGNHFDNDAWITLITRLATRAPSNLDQTGSNDGDTNGDAQLGELLKNNGIADNIRETLLKWITTDFRHRINVAISWLNEEWYNEEVLRKSNPDFVSTDTYNTWTFRLLDSISPYLDAKDKSILRFLSEIPALDDGVFKRVKSIANDPDKASLAVNALHYLVVTRPPAREQALDALQDLNDNYQGAAIFAKKVLTKWRPGAAAGVPAATLVKQEESRAASSTPTPGDGSGAALGANAAGAGTNGNTQMVATES